MKDLCVSSGGNEINLKHYWLRFLLAFPKCEDGPLLPQIIALAAVRGHKVQQTATVVSGNEN